MEKALKNNQNEFDSTSGHVNGATGTILLLCLVMFTNLNIYHTFVWMTGVAQQYSQSVVIPVVWYQYVKVSRKENHHPISRIIPRLLKRSPAYPSPFHWWRTNHTPILPLHRRPFSFFRRRFRGCWKRNNTLSLFKPLHCVLANEKPEEVWSSDTECACTGCVLGNHSGCGTLLRLRNLRA